MKKIGFIGCGNMGGALAKVAAATDNEIFVSDINAALCASFAETNGAAVSTNEEIAEKCDMIFLGIKPQVIGSVLESVKDVLNKRKDRFVLVSMAAGVDIETLLSYVGATCPIIRIMPNTPAAVGSGVILYCLGGTAVSEDAEDFKSLMAEAGMCDCLPEKLIDAASAISGCGPAFVYMFIQSLADGGVRCGLPRDKALMYAAATVRGAAENVLRSNIHPEALKDAVCSPAGSTIEGVMALENGGFRSQVSEAVTAAFERTKELGK